MKFNRVFAVIFPTLLGAACLHASRGLKAPQAFAAPSVSTASRPASLEAQSVSRLRHVKMNLDLFSEARAQEFTEKKLHNTNWTERIEMNFFPNVNITVNWNQVQRADQPAGLVWSGNVVGARAGHAVLAISGKNITGTVTRGDGWIYEIRTAADGELWVREIDQKKFPREREPVAPGRE